MIPLDIPSFLNRIISFNAAWKHAREQWGAESTFAIMLRKRKSDAQIELLRSFPQDTYLKVDTESEADEPLYSVRLRVNTTLKSGLVRSDADHLPVRIAHELMGASEISNFLKSNHI